MIYSGQVVWFSNKKGYGFISYYEDNKRKEIFLHFTDIKQTGYRTINKQDNVSFEIGINRHNIPKAINVTKLI